MGDMLSIPVQVSAGTAPDLKITVNPYDGKPTAYLFGSATAIARLLLIELERVGASKGRLGPVRQRAAERAKDLRAELEQLDAALPALP